MKSAAALAAAVAVVALVALSAAAPDAPSEGYKSMEPEQMALLTVFDLMESAYGHGDSWILKHPDHCQWKGVGCDAARRVVSVAGISPPVPRVAPWAGEAARCLALHGDALEALAGLPHLEVLDLSRLCLVGGTLPRQWNATNLKRLSLANWEHAKDVRLPEDWAQSFPNLEILSLVNCSLSGTLPAVWGQGFRQLRELYLNGNELSGPLPPSWAEGAPRLAVMDLQYNNFSGAIPAAWSSPRFPSLLRMSLSGNPLGSQLPEAWALPDALFTLELVDCGVRWSPATASTMLGHPTLDTLHARGNQLRGQLPLSFCNTTLATLDLGSNQLSGSLPGCDGVLPLWSSLSHLMLDDNNISGTLPSTGWLVRFGDLRILRLHKTQLSGSIPRGWLELDIYPKLSHLDLSYTGVDVLPAWTAITSRHVLSRVVYLGLAGCNMTGPIPEYTNTDQYTHVNEKPFHELRELDLSNNLLTGTLPASWAINPRLASLFTLNLSSNRLTGPIPQEWFDLPYWGDLAYLDLHGNEIDGRIPPLNSALRDVLLIARPGNRALCLSPSAMTAWRYKLCSSDDASQVVGTLGRLCLASGLESCPRLSKEAVGRAVVFGLIMAVAALALAISLLRKAKAVKRQRFPSSKRNDDDLRDILGQLEDNALLESTVEMEMAVTGGTAVLGELNPGGLHVQLEEQRPREPGAAAPQLGGTAGSEGAPNGAGASRPSIDGSLCALMDINLSDLKFIKRPDGSLELLGSGGQAKVYGAMLHRTFRVAVKVLPHTGGDVGLLMREAEVLFRCSHPNILQLFGICQAPSLLMLVSEFMAGGTLADALQSPDYRWYKRGKATLLQIVSGLLYLHQKSICHFDIKPANIMFDVDGVAKLCDAGLARILEASAISSIREGTLTYAAPETIMGQRTGPPADVFSLGVVMQELITGERLIRRGGSRAIRVPEDCPQSISDLIEQCKQTTPAARPTVAGVMQALLASDEQGSEV